ncbi:MAG: hypothetical protein R3E97_21685 [Candidatus Eisenbacteria bacterium]
MLAVGVSSLLLSVGIDAQAGIEDDEEESIGDVGFSVPTEILSEKRHDAAAHGFSVLSGISTYWSDDDNVFHSPDELEATAASWGNWAYLRGDTRFSGTRMLNTVKWKQERFPDEPIIDTAYFSSSNWFDREILDGLDLELDFDLSHQNDASANVEGLDYARTYEYWRYAAETVVEWSPTRLHRIRVGAEATKKNYDETEGMNSIDWTQWLATASYRFRPASGRWVKLSYTTGQRNYADEPASIESGRELPDNPMEKHRYEEFEISLDSRLTSILDLELGYTWDTKEDLFRNYESRRTEEFRAELSMDLRQGVELRVEGTRAWRDYDLIQGDNGNLKYRTQEIAGGGRVRVLSPVWLFAQLGYYERDTNKSTGTVYRSFQGTRTRAGLSLFF